MSSAATPLPFDLSAMTPDQVAQLLAQLQQLQVQQPASAAETTNTDREDATRGQASGGVSARMQSESAVSTATRGERATPTAGASKGTEGPQSETESVVRRRKAKGKQRAVEAAPGQKEPERQKTTKAVGNPEGASRMRHHGLLPPADVAILSWHSIQRRPTPVSINPKPTVLY